MWDPQQYLAYADQRARPFHDLVARVRADRVRHVVDLGCGPGGLTASLVQRWPDARVVGVDSSAEMIARAREGEDAEFVHADLRDWEPDTPVDVLLSNAALQWVPHHLDLMPRFRSFLADSGWLAFQVPGNFGEPTHVQLRELATSTPWAERLDVAWPKSHEPGEYLAALLDAGFAAEVWETTYFHLLGGPDDVVGWLGGTALRPVLDQLDEPRQAEFVEQLRGRLSAYYPAGPHGAVMPYRRIFAVAHLMRRAPSR